MNKLLLALLVTGLLVGCSKSNDDSVKNIEPSKKEQTIDTSKENQAFTTEEYINKFKSAGLTIDKIVTYTEETDLNKQLGRPNQYIAKVNWSDSKLEQPTAESLVGGTIEIFNNEADLQSRKQYIENVTKDMPMVNQYIYVNGLALLRLDKEFTPSQAKEYEAVFMKF